MQRILRIFDTGYIKKFDKIHSKEVFFTWPQIIWVLWLYRMVPYHIISLEKLDEKSESSSTKSEKLWFLKILILAFRTWLFKTDRCSSGTASWTWFRLDRRCNNLSQILSHCTIEPVLTNQFTGIWTMGAGNLKILIFWFCHELAISHVQTSLWLIDFTEWDWLRSGSNTG